MSEKSWKREIFIGGLGSVVGALIIGTFGVISNWGQSLIDIDIDPGAIVAFDLNDCPAGWDNVAQLDQRKFAGRTLVIAGPATVRNPESQNTTQRSHNGNGGEGGQESVTLTLSQIPTHNHGGLWGGTESIQGMRNEHKNDTAGRKQIEPDGGGQPHNNMPPFVVATFCKKR